MRGKCKHKRELDANEAGFPECDYPNFCDYQLPRDSRGKEEQFLQRALGIIEDMIDENGCSYDHHGNCQEHGWTLIAFKCPHARAKELLSEIKIQ